MILLLILLFTNYSFADDSSDEFYKELNGKWNAPSQDSEMDVFMNISPNGKFTISIKPAFEYTNLSVQDQEKVIKSVVTSKGHLKFLNTIFHEKLSEHVLFNTEISLNNEFSTNLLEILSNQVFIFDESTQQKHLFLQR